MICYYSQLLLAHPSGLRRSVIANSGGALRGLNPAERGGHLRLLMEEQGHAINQHVLKKEHNLPHIHAIYQDSSAEFLIADGQLLSGNLPVRQGKLVEAWIELHREELLADWELAKSGEVPFRIEPLR